MRKIGTTGNDRIAGANPVSPKQIFGSFIREGELSILCAKTGVGKTILAMTIADAISKGTKTIIGLNNELSPTKTLYYDYELTKEQFRERFQQYSFSDNLTFVCDEELEDVQLTTDIIRADINGTQSKVVIIDNITMMLGSKAYNPDATCSLFRSLKNLTREGITVIAVCHTPKLKANTPLTEDHILGSSMAVKQVGSAFFISESSQGNDIRYIKQVKSSSRKENRILECEVVDKNGFLTLDFNAWGLDETEHFGKKVSKEMLVDWNDVFGMDVELTTNQLKERLLEQYQMKDSTARKYYSKYLEPVKKGAGIYRIPPMLQVA